MRLRSRNIGLRAIYWLEVLDHEITVIGSSMFGKLVEDLIQALVWGVIVIVVLVAVVYLLITR